MKCPLIVEQVVVIVRSALVGDHLLDMEIGAGILIASISWHRLGRRCLADRYRVYSFQRQRCGLIEAQAVDRFWQREPASRQCMSGRVDRKAAAFQEIGVLLIDPA